MERDYPETPSAEPPEPVPPFEAPRLTPLGTLADLTRAFEPGVNTDFTMSSF